MSTLRLYETLLCAAAPIIPENFRRIVSLAAAKLRVNDVETSTKRSLFSSHRRGRSLFRIILVCIRLLRTYAIATSSEVHTLVRRVIDWWRTHVARDPDLDVNETLQVDERKKKKKVNYYTFLGVIEANRRGNDRDFRKMNYCENDTTRNWEKERKKERREFTWFSLFISCSNEDLRLRWVPSYLSYDLNRKTRRHGPLDMNVVLMLI